MNRGVAQLTRLDLGYSLHAGASKGVREFVASPLLAEFQAQHPHVKVKALVNSRGFPHVEASYLNNGLQHVSLRYAQDAKSVHAALVTLAGQTGRPLKGLAKWPFPQTRMSSVQGRWDSAFTLKTPEEQLAPLLKQQTHLIGLAPTEESMAAAAAKVAKK